MQRRREQEKEKLNDEERKKKLAKLRLLKKKLEMLESEQSVDTTGEQTLETTEEIWQPPTITTQKTKETPQQTEDDYLESINSELDTLTQELAQEISTQEPEEKIKSHSQIISKALNKFLPENEEASKPEDQSEIDAELSKLQQEIEMEQNKAAVTISIFDQLCEEHEWLKQPQFGFMYTMPNKKKEKRDYESWLDDWRKVLFDYAQLASKHIIYSRKLLSEKPWSEFRDRTESITEISESLVKRKMAEWLDKKKKKLRVYWRSLEAWADEIIDWIKQTPITGPVMFQDIRNADKGFSDLPNDDLYKIFTIIGKRDDAEKHKLDNGELAITVKFF